MSICQQQEPQDTAQAEMDISMTSEPAAEPADKFSPIVNPLLLYHRKLYEPFRKGHTSRFRVKEQSLQHSSCATYQKLFTCSIDHFLVTLHKSNNVLFKRTMSYVKTNCKFSKTVNEGKSLFFISMLYIHFTFLHVSNKINVCFFFTCLVSCTDIVIVL